MPHRKFTPIGHHTTCRLVDGRVIAPTTEARREVARIVLERFKAHRLLCFNVPDTHLHIHHGEDRRTAGELARRIEIALTRRLGLPVGFATAQHEPVRNQHHLFKAFDYVLRQQPRHGLEWDPYHDASNLPDLLGLRVMGQNTAHTVRQMLPRVGRLELLRYFNINDLRETDGPLSELRPAALAASGLSSLRGRSAGVRSLRQAMLVVARGRLPQREAAALVGVDARTLRRQHPPEANPGLVRAIRLQLGLRAVVAPAAAGVFVERETRATPCRMVT